ncbi:MAG: flagellar basal-body rod protein FlgG [Lentisphaeria bacterium]|nr:flagellar basal-body rod protein FlgG [Lentisphaeria bacterium]NQZ70020.1 flagellar basal-body rod protein FlgG [Lentisphaeria bacterium]
MNRALWISATGMQSQQALTDTIANNMANVNTTGFKRSVVHFEDLIYQTEQAPGAETSGESRPVGIEKGSGVKTVAISKIFTQGTLKNSSSPLDLAIEGKGFFEVQLPDGSTAYTRAGKFSMDPNGQVVTTHGYVVQGFPSLNTNASLLEISADGTISQLIGGTSISAGQISLSRFPNVEGLSSIGQGLFLETSASGTPISSTPGSGSVGNIAQYFLEGSNVEIITEMVELIAAQRAYELQSKSIRTADEMLRMTNNMK